MTNPFSWTHATRCMAGASLLFIFNTLYLAGYAVSYAFAPTDTAIDQAYLPVVAVVSGVSNLVLLVLVLLGWRLRARVDQIHWLLNITVAMSCWDVLYSVYFYGLFTHFYSGAAIIGGWTIGLIFYPSRKMAVMVSFSLVLLLLLTAAAEASLIPYAPLFLHEPGGMPQFWTPLNGLTLLLMGALMIIIYFMIELWKNREAELRDTRDKLAAANAVVSRYVANQLADQVRLGTHANMERHERRKLTVVFSDIKGFSLIADQIAPEQLAWLLNDYLSAMADIAHRHEATIDKFVGDAIMVFFGAPHDLPEQEQALRAVRMAIEMQERMHVLRRQWSMAGIGHLFHIRIGINTGFAIVGAFGSNQRLEYTAIGRQVNLTARIQAHCRAGHVLISHSTWQLVNQVVDSEPLGEVLFQGNRDPVAIYDVRSERLTDALV